jgi:hypothetical protein
MQTIFTLYAPQGKMTKVRRPQLLIIAHDRSNRLVVGKNLPERDFAEPTMQPIFFSCGIQPKSAKIASCLPTKALIISRWLPEIWPR